MPRGDCAKAVGSAQPFSTEVYSGKDIGPKPARGRSDWHCHWIGYLFNPRTSVHCNAVVQATALRPTSPSGAPLEL